MTSEDDGPESDPSSAWADSITVGGWAAHRELPMLISTSGQLHPAVATAPAGS